MSVQEIHNDPTMTPQEKALAIAFQYGSFDGGHHKMWCIDQMVRALCSTPETYEEWIKTYCEGEDGPETYEWDKGTPP